MCDAGSWESEAHFFGNWRFGGWRAMCDAGWEKQDAYFNFLQV